MYSGGGKASRFSLDLLDEGEHHLGELQAEWQTVPGKSVPDGLKSGSGNSGKLHLTTAGVFFEPERLADPVLKVAFVHMRRPVAALTDAGEVVDHAEAGGRASALVLQAAMVTHMMAHGRPSPYRDVIVDAPGAAGTAGVARGSGDIRKAVKAKLQELRETGMAAGWLRSAGLDASKQWWPPAAPLRGRTAAVVRLAHASATEPLALLARLFSAAHAADGSPAAPDAVATATQALVAERWRGEFDRSLLSGFSERLVLTEPMLVLVVEGTSVRRCRLMLSDAAIYLQPSGVDNPSGAAPPPSFPYSRLTRVWRRRRFMRETGLELVSGSGQSAVAVLLEAGSVGEREQLVAEIAQRVPDGVLMGESLLFRAGRRAPHDAATGAAAAAAGEAAAAAGAAAGASAAESASAAAASLADVPSQLLSQALRQVGWLDEALARTVVSRCRQWQEGGISTHEYLTFLNAAAGRSRLDLGQYPVFPWVLADYASEKLDLKAPAAFRDLSKPIGALSPSRIASLRERVKHMPPGEGEEAPFLYGTHYSTPGYVLYFRVRELPEGHIRLQSGKFDNADRMFLSVAATWEGVLNHSADFKELTPEFYSGDGRFLRNSRGLDLGLLQAGESVGDVELPPWCRSPRDFVRRMREALESDHVSQHIHAWIDLVFGCKQRGPAAEAADNLFYPLTYEGTVDMDAITDQQRLRSLRAQIAEFGQTPRQLFQRPHPTRTGPKLPRSPMALIDESHREAEVGDGGAPGLGAAAAATSAAPLAGLSGTAAGGRAGLARIATGGVAAGGGSGSSSPFPGAESGPSSPWASVEQEAAEPPTPATCPALRWRPLQLERPASALGRAAGPGAPGTPMSASGGGRSPLLSPPSARRLPVAGPDTAGEFPSGDFVLAHSDKVTAAAASPSADTVWTLSSDRTLCALPVGRSSTAAAGGDGESAAAEEDAAACAGGGGSCDDEAKSQGGDQLDDGGDGDSGGDGSVDGAGVTADAGATAASGGSGPPPLTPGCDGGTGLRPRVLSRRLFGALPTCLAALPAYGGCCFAADAEGGLAAVDTRTGSIVGRGKRVHGAAVLSLACGAGSAEGSAVLASASADRTVRVCWGPRAGQAAHAAAEDAIRMARGESEAAVFREHRAPATAVALRPGGGAMISGDAEGVLVWYALGDGPAGSRPAVVNDMLKCPAGEPLGGGPRFTAGVAGLAWAPASGAAASLPAKASVSQRAAERVVVALASGRVVVANGAGDLLAAVAAGEVLHAAAFAGGSRWAVTAGSHGALRVWDVAAAELETARRRTSSVGDSGATAASSGLPVLAAGALEVRRDTAFPPGSKPAAVPMSSAEQGWSTPGGSGPGGSGPRTSMTRGRAAARSEDGDGMSGRRRSAGMRGRGGDAAAASAAAADAAATGAADDESDGASSEDLDAVLDDLLEGEESDGGDDQGDGAMAMSARRAVGSPKRAAQAPALSPPVLERAPWMLKGLGPDQHGVITALVVLNDGSSVVCGTRCGVLAAWSASPQQ
ncbi:hypothetical protein FNF29_05657 [Cafeteria roenbergensis]|uniref:BEACH domain-containing protein n=1 Tax=Cafeteria roenbergensis TaxID=33653 RepID=A0A5A8C9P7_CAFRO|nr:hypothetical protein FNF29_05657 [Cafeteria roenbergensis]|eukprot:KAA0149832.1 hypothetical protein FNF29_05657 [Cafeteria roenbergensis]